MNRIIEVTRRGLRGEAAGVGMSGTAQHGSSALQLTFADQGKVIWTEDASPGGITLPTITTIGDGWHVIIKASSVSGGIGVAASAGAAIDDSTGQSFSVSSVSVYSGQIMILYFDGVATFTAMRFADDWSGPFVGPATRGVDIVSGNITVTSDFHVVYTEASAASDDVDTINVMAYSGLYPSAQTGFLPRPGRKVTFVTISNARAVVFKNGTGNIRCGADRTLNNIYDTITFVQNKTGQWLMTSFADNA